MINLDEYFARIDYSGSTRVSVANLYNIHRAQVFAIPFENLSLHILPNEDSHKTKLDEKSLVEKIIKNKRGGNCYETNELLCLVLLQLGFKVERLAARVLEDDKTPLFHKLLLVTINEEKYIADVGFGMYGLIEPIKLQDSIVVQQFYDKFRLSRDGIYYKLDINVKDRWRPLYSFSLASYTAFDYEPLNFYVTQLTKSPIVKNKICAIASPNNRILLENYNLNIMSNGKNVLIHS